MRIVSKPGTVVKLWSLEVGGLSCPKGPFLNFAGVGQVGALMMGVWGLSLVSQNTTIDLTYSLFGHEGGIYTQPLAFEFLQRHFAWGLPFFFFL
jgi:hypothetical protein